MSASPSAPAGLPATLPCPYPNIDGRGFPCCYNVPSPLNEEQLGPFLTHFREEHTFPGKRGAKGIERTLKTLIAMSEEVIQVGKEYREAEAKVTLEGPDIILFRDELSVHNSIPKDEDTSVDLQDLFDDFAYNNDDIKGAVLHARLLGKALISSIVSKFGPASVAPFAVTLEERLLVSCWEDGIEIAAMSRVFKDTLVGTMKRMGD